MGMSVFGGIAGILLSFSFFISRGLNQVIMADALNSRTPASFRATANSLVSFMFRGIYIVTGPLVGLLIDAQGISITLAVLGVVVAVAFVLFMVPLLVSLKAAEKKAKVEVSCG